MKTFHFETNLKCSACESKVRENLGKELLIKEVNVDLEDPRKTLTVKAQDPLTEAEILVLIQEAGFKAEPIKGFFKKFFTFF